MQILFLRHGQTDWNREGRLQGRSDPPLNATGLAEAAEAARRLAQQEVGRIVSSPLSRAGQTAEIVARGLGRAVTTDAMLIERSFGALEGRLLSEIGAEHGTGYDIASSDRLPPDAEPWAAFRDRIAAAADRWLSGTAEGPALLVSHLGVMTALCDALGTARIAAANATPYRFHRSGGCWVVDLVLEKS